MKKVFLPLLFSFSLFANPFENLSFAAEWLYFMPSFDQNAYLWDGNINMGGSATNRIATRIGERQKYYSAYRLEGAYLFCNQINEITVRYTNFHHSYFKALSANPSERLLGINIESSQGNVISCAFDRDYRYYNIEGLFTLYRASICGFYPSIAGGIKFAHLHIKEKAHYGLDVAPTSQFAEPDMRGWALGPAAELNGDYGLTSCLNLTGRFLFGVLANQTRSKLWATADQTFETGSLLVKNTPKFWHVIRSMETRIGLEFCKALRCGTFQLEGGYELIDEFDIISRLYNCANPAISFDEWSDFTLTGPYLRINLSY